MHSSTASSTRALSGEDEKLYTPPLAQSSPSGYQHRYAADEYEIEHLAHYDDIDLVRPLHRKLLLVQPLLLVFVFASFAVYFSYRVWINYQYRKTQDGAAGAWALTFVEGLTMIPVLLWMSVVLPSMGDRKRPKLRLRGDATPTVDVLLTTCGEDISMILNTIKAACNIDYPHDRYRVLVCDDGRDEALQEAVKALGAIYPQLFYQSRTKTPGVPHHYKAGNLQSGIDHVQCLPGGSAEYMATLDADMIPSTDWLRALVPHLLRDPRLGLIAPPQTFWNLPRNDPLCQSLCDFIHYFELRKDNMGAAWCTGSGVVFKRFIVDELGGWPTGSLAEDQLLSYMMNGNGYTTGYLHEFLQVGMVPESILGHLKQRIRWAIGGLETANILKWGLPSKLTRNMTFRQRWCLFALALSTVMTIPIFVISFVVPAMLFWGKDLLVYVTPDQLRWQLRLCAMLVWSLAINEIVVTIQSGYIQGQHVATASPFMTPYFALSVIRCLMLPSWLGGTRIAFQATGAVSDELNERQKHARAGLWKRLGLLTLHCNLWYFAAHIAYCLSAVGFDWWRAWGIGVRSGHVQLLLRHLLVNSLLPPMWWLFTVIGMMIPLAYAIFPPTVPPMEDILEYDVKTGVGRPTTMEVKQTWNCLTLTRQICWGLVVIYVSFLFVGTFIW